MAKKKKTTKAEAAEVENQNVTPAETAAGKPETPGNDPKAEKVKDQVDRDAANKSAGQPQASQDASNSKSDTNTPAEKNNASTAAESSKGQTGENGPDDSALQAASKDPRKGSGGFQVYPSAQGELEEISDDEVQSRDQEQAVKYNKLKAVAYNRYRDTKFTKLPKRLRIDELSDLSKLPPEVSIDSEILMDNGQVYTLKDQLTQKFNKDALISL